MERIRRLGWMTGVLALVTLVLAMPSPSPAAVGMKICHIISEKNHNGRALEAFVKRIGELTNGQIDAKVYHAGALQTPMSVSRFKAYGAIPTPIPWPETYLALAQGTVDGAETALVAMHDNRQYEVAKHASRTKHAISAAPFVVSERWWQSLTPE